MARTTFYQRLGISLLEVLISIGVVSIGLLGVVSLIPVASQQAEQGARNDRKANVGRRSFREFSVRGYLNAGTRPNDENWIGYPYYSRNENKKRVFRGNRFQRRPFCIDPRHVAAQQDNSGNYLFTQRGQAARFEFGQAPRIGGFAPMGQQGPATGGSGMSVISLSPGVTTGPPFMTQQQAEEVFVFQDDLEFELPTSNADLPTQTFLTADLDGGGPNPPQNVKRYAKGQFSWFVTVVPESGDWWTLSTVICYQRNNLAYPDALGIVGKVAHAPPTADPTTSKFYTAGAAGGDVRIQWNQPLPRQPRSGDWLLLGKKHNNNTMNDTADDFQVYGWYRVVYSAEPELLLNNVPFQDLTLEGPDWEITPALVGNETFVTWIPEVVAVYSKQVRITNQ